MRLPILLFALLIIGSVSSYKRFKPFEKSLKLQAIFQDIVSQNNIKGFFIYNFLLPSEKKFFVDKQIHDVVQQASRVATVVYIQYRSNTRYKFNLRKYSRNVSRFGVANHHGFYVHHHLAIGGDTCALFIIDYTRLMMARRQHERIASTYSLFHSKQGVSKTLIIAVVDRKFPSFKRWFAGTLRNYTCNINILEIRRNRRNKRESSRYTLIAWNPFRNTCTRRSVKRGMNFFPALGKDLNGHRLTIMTFFQKLYSFDDISYNEKDIFLALASLLDKYPLQTAVTKLNASCNFILWKDRKRSLHFELELTGANNFPKSPTLHDTFLFPSYGLPAYFLAPSIHDERAETPLGAMLFSGVIILSVILIFWAFGKLHKFDAMTWEPIVLFSMIIGAANPRNPVRFGETVMFLCLITVGFFFGGDLIFGMTSAVIKVYEERPVLTLDDVISNNITMYLYASTENAKKCFGSEIFSKLKYADMSRMQQIEWVKCFGDMLVNDNVSLSTGMFAVLGIPAPQRIMINKIVYARRTYIKEAQYGVLIIATRCNRPWFRQLNYNLLRFHESSLLSHPRFLNLQHIVYMEYIGYHIISLESEIAEEEEEESVIGFVQFWTIIVTGFILPSLLLVGEFFVSSYVFAK